MREGDRLILISIIIAVVIGSLFWAVHYSNDINNNYCKELGYEGSIFGEGRCYNSVNGMREPSYNRLPPISERKVFKNSGENKK